MVIRRAHQEYGIHRKVSYRDYHDGVWQQIVYNELVTLITKDGYVPDPSTGKVQVEMMAFLDEQDGRPVQLPLGIVRGMGIDVPESSIFYWIRATMIGNIHPPNEEDAPQT